MDTEKWNEIKDKINRIKINIKKGEFEEFYEALGITKEEYETLYNVSTIFNTDNVFQMAKVLSEDIKDNRMLSVLAIIFGRDAALAMIALSFTDAVNLAIPDIITLAYLSGIDTELMHRIQMIDLGLDTLSENVVAYDELYKYYDRDIVFVALYVYHKADKLKEEVGGILSNLLRR